MKELTEFDIFEALDRTHTIQVMVENLLGYADEYPDETTLVHKAIEKHHVLLRNVQDNLSELYQKLGEDLDKSCEKKESDALVTLIKISQEDIANGRTFTVEEAIERMKMVRGK